MASTIYLSGKMQVILKNIALLGGNSLFYKRLKRIENIIHDIVKKNDFLNSDIFSTSYEHGIIDGFARQDGFDKMLGRLNGTEEVYLANDKILSRSYYYFVDTFRESKIGKLNFSIKPAYNINTQKIDFSLSINIWFGRTDEDRKSDKTRYIMLTYGNIFKDFNFLSGYENTLSKTIENLKDINEVVVEMKKVADAYYKMDEDYKELGKKTKKKDS